MSDTVMKEQMDLFDEMKADDIKAHSIDAVFQRGYEKGYARGNEVGISFGQSTLSYQWFALILVLSNIVSFGFGLVSCFGMQAGSMKIQNNTVDQHIEQRYTP